MALGHVRVNRLAFSYEFSCCICKLVCLLIALNVNVELDLHQFDLDRVACSWYQQLCYRLEHGAMNVIDVLCRASHVLCYFIHAAFGVCGNDLSVVWSAPLQYDVD